MKLEIEVKAKVKDFETLKNKLEEIGCILSAPISQDDYIYNRKGLDIRKEKTATTEWNVGSTNLLNIDVGVLKDPILEQIINQEIEYLK